MIWLRYSLPISQRLVNDGDKSLVIQDKVIIEVAERNMKGIVPLYYEMSKAEAQEINSKNIYDSLIMAYKANIGEISNNITKIWNSDEVDLNAIKWFCMENNFQIDFAKTLFMPERPEKVDQILSKYVKNKVPHFFVFAKDKDRKRVERLNNSTVNKLKKLIPNKRINFEKIAGKFDYSILMCNEDVNVSKKITNLYSQFDRQKRWMKNDSDDLKTFNSLYMYRKIRDKLLELNSDEEYVTDVLVKYLYGKRNTKHKTTLWNIFGDVLNRNIKNNLDGTIRCEKCGERVPHEKQRQMLCIPCQDKETKEKNKARKQRQRMSR